MITLPRTEDMERHRQAVTETLASLAPDIAEASSWEAETLHYARLPRTARAPVVVRGAPAEAGPVPPDPAVLTALARQTLGLPSPVIRSSQAQAALQLTNLPTWLWISPAEWVPESKTATVVPGESVTATPVSVTCHPGDGSTVTCQGAGTPYTSADNPGSAAGTPHLRRAARRRFQGDGQDC